MEFINIIDKLYYSLFEPMDSMCKFDSIKRCKYFLGLDEKSSLGEYYETSNLNKKGVVYTPEAIAAYMADNTIDIEIIKNPFLKILDPSCGCGHILLYIFKYLKSTYTDNLNVINETHGLSLSEESINEHIVKNNIYGVDIDKTALKIFAIELFSIAGYIEKDNLINIDFLTENIEIKFDIIIGNPPYIGTKAMEKVYSNKLRLIYSDVYNDKGDLSYCFFMKALSCVKSEYKITFITSRYFMESLSGQKLRKYLTSFSNINKIIDFYGSRPFKNAGIDPVIIFLESKECSVVTVKKPKAKIKAFSGIDDLGFKTILIQSKSLSSSPWRLQEEKALKIIKAIESRNHIFLSDICWTYQGIITGLDRAFIVDNSTIEQWNIERDILKPWIKNSSVSKGRILSKNELFIIYSDLIKEEKDYPNAIAYIYQYKDRLEQRRECKSGKRKWYQLQWGRDADIFDGQKLIFPYKCEENRFALDKGSYFSADVYCLVIKDNIFMNADYEFLQIVLNSYLYEFYFKCFAKKLGGKLFEYYPNNLNRLSIPISTKIKNQEDLYSYYELSKEQIRYIEGIEEHE